MTALLDALITDGRAVFSSYKEQFKMMGIALPLVFGFLFLVAVVYTIWRFSTDLNRVLRAVKQDTVEKSLFPISLGVREAKLDRGASRLAKRTNVVYRFLNS
jgi:hypothetical protein